MKVMHRFIAGIALALSVALSSVAFAADRVVAVLASSQEMSYAACSAKFHGDLARNIDMKAVVVASVDSGLLRDSHGFRQATALEPVEPNLALS